MTVSSTIREASFTGNGATTVFPFTYKVFLTTDVIVQNTLFGTTSPVIQAVGTHYTITINGDQDASPGGSVTMLAAPATGDILQLISNVPITQNAHLTSVGGTVIEHELDRIAIGVQQVAYNLAAALVGGTLPLLQAVQKTSVTGNAHLPGGTTGQRDVGVFGDIRANSTGSAIEWFDGTNWRFLIDAAGIHAATNKATPVDADEVGIWDSVSGLLNKVTWANIKATLKTYFDGIYTTLAASLANVIATANLWTAQQRPKYLSTATASGGGSFAFDPTTHGQVALITLTTAGVVTMSAPTNIVEGAPYTMLLKAGDTNARTFAWNAAFKFGGATSALATATAVSAAIDSINWIGGATNTLIYNGHKGDIR